jgi:hypothetical protein
MGNVNVTRLGAEAQVDADIDFEDKAQRNHLVMDPFPRRPALSSQAIMALGICGGVGWLGVLLVLAAWRGVVCWDYCYGPEADAINVLWWLWLWLPAAGAVLGGTTLAAGWVMEQRARAARQALTRDRYGNAVSAPLVLRMSQDQVWRQLVLATQTDVATAPHRWARGVDALNINGPPPAAPAALPAPTVEIGPLALERWAAYVDTQPHTMLAAKTGGGKTTLAKFILARRIAAGGQVMIIDPHWSPHTWWGLPGHGAGENWDAIEAAIEAVTAEYRKRIAEYGQGVTDFRRLTVLVDDAIVIRELMKLVGRDNVWTRFAVVLGSGARKVAVSVIPMTQSVNVADLGISGPLRENYARIALDSRACKQLIADDMIPSRRDALYAALPGAGNYPATMDINGEVYYLDRASVVDVSKPAGADDAIWQPVVTTGQATMPSIETDRQTASTSRRRAGALEELERLSVCEKLTSASAAGVLRPAGFGRIEARVILRGYGLGLDNDTWADAKEDNEL